VITLDTHHWSSETTSDLLPRGLCRIGDRWVDGDADRVALDDNPTTESPLAVVALASGAQVDAAVAAARAQLDGGAWSRFGPADRRLLMLRLVELMDTHRAELADLLVNEIGCPISLALSTQVAVAIDDLQWFAEAAGRSLDIGLPVHKGGAARIAGELIREPAGVVAAITAYNYPYMILVWKIGAILATGCTGVVLPSPRAPLCTAAFFRLFEEAGFPDGTLNLLMGDAEVGTYLVESPAVDVVSFTGSVAAGRSVMATAAGTIKKVVLELGGKSPNVLLPAVEPAGAAEPALLRVIRNSGQNCGATSRILVHEDAYDAFCAGAAAAMPRITVGDPWDPSTLLGPVISGEHREFVEGVVERALASGAELVAGGGRPDQTRGYFVNPTLLGAIAHDAEAVQREIFGPVGVVVPYRDIDHAVELANATDFGLAANVVGPLPEAYAVARRIRAGNVTINGGGGLRPDGPWGGVGHSGIGRERGDEGIREFTEVKHIQWAL
jgi:aldehyde dehydrogenase (NAD+)/betaine-aldehyde dehydrogenase